MITKLITILLFTPLLVSAQSYDYFFDGDTSNIIISSTYGICLMGGATENDQGAEWFLNRADGGNILVLRTSGSDGYQDYFYNDLGVSVQSVETIVLNNSASANDPFVLRRIENADAIWLAGGDQYLYESYFKTSPIRTLLNTHVNVKEAPIGGTSAGMAILGEFYFNAENGTITSNEALNNPYDQNLTVESNFISIRILDNTITDTHYDNPDRKGRHVAFLSRMQESDPNADYFGIAADEYVAICIDFNGIATVYGEYPDYEDNAYFLRTNCQQTQPAVLQSGTPLMWGDNDPAVLVCNVKGTENSQGQFNLNTWLDVNGESWEGWSVDHGVLTSELIQHSGCTIGVNENETNDEETTLYPNPTSKFVQVKSQDEIIGVEVFDILGKRVAKFENEKKISIEHLTRGVYQFVIENQNQKFVTQKVVLVE